MCIHISVKRWKDKVNGNSYFSGVIFRDGAVVARMSFQYGYGSMPNAMAYIALRDAGIVTNPRACYATWALEDMGIPCTYDEAWVTKRECKAHVA